ncbi:MAG: glycosyltransferase family protein, partial [Romboutsia sp.]|nr:glycosyltransferase family protein [Romboutsia sp.]
MYVAIVQARSSSTRMPGKVLKTICRKPMILHQLERISKSKLIDSLVIATSSYETDDELARVCINAGYKVFRGDLNNVLSRYYHAALQENATHIIRLTGDCPLSDPLLIDEMINFYQNNNFDYVSNAVEATYPDGLDVEIFSMHVLQRMYINATLNSELEHVTSYVHNNFDKFNCYEFKNKKYKYISKQDGIILETIDLSSMRWTVDEPEDFN